MTRPRPLTTLGVALEQAQRATGLSRSELAARLVLDRSSLMRLGRGDMAAGPYSRARIAEWARSLPAAIGTPVLAAIGVAVAPAAPVEAAPRIDVPRHVEEALFAMADELDVGARSLRRALTRFVGRLHADAVPLEGIVAALEAIERRHAAVVDRASE